MLYVLDIMFYLRVLVIRTVAWWKLFTRF